MWEHGNVFAGIICLLTLSLFLHNLMFNSYSAVETTTTVVYSTEDMNSYYTDEMLNKCGHMVTRMVKWHNAIQENPTANPVVMLVNDHGLGDRLGGIATQVLYSMDHGRSLQLYWGGLGGVFKFPDFLPKDQFYIRNDPPSSKCHVRRGVPAGAKCKDFMGGQKPKCWESEELTVSGQRMCANRHLCEEALEHNRLTFKNVTAVSPVQTIGCALRSFLQPRESFLNQKFDWFVRGDTVSWSVLELQEFLKDFTTVALHVRAGDPTFGSNHSSNRLIRLVSKTVQCGDTIYAKDSSGKPKLLLFASDSEVQRRRIRNERASEVVMLMAKPKHLYLNSITQESDAEQNNERVQKALEEENRLGFAEWLLLGKCDHVVVGTLFESSRVSWFPYTSLLYNLKPYAYNSDSCVKRNIRRISKPDASKEQYHKVCHAETRDTEMFERLDHPLI